MECTQINIFLSALSEVLSLEEILLPLLFSIATFS